MAGKSVEVWAGSDAMAAIAKPSLRAQWLELCDHCAWATVCQHPDLIALHWQIHHDLFEPILIAERDATGKLTGLLALYRDGAKFGNGAGYDTEYNVWITAPESAETFMPAALQALRAIFGSLELHLEFLPADVPLNWTKEDPSVSAWCSLTPIVQYVIRVEPGKDVLSTYRGKSRLKSKINKFKAMGAMHFHLVTDPADLERVLARFTTLFDFRKGAMFGIFGFRGDSHRSKFLRELFKTGLMSVGSLELNGKVAAAHFGLEGKGGMYSLGGIAHDEFLAKVSPGIILQMHLFKAAMKRGYTTIDLTPGDDVYKTHWSNETRTAFKLDVRSSRLKHVVTTVKDRARSAARKIMQHVIGASTTARHSDAPPVESTLLVPVYRLLPVESTAPAANAHWRADSIEDLLQYPGEGTQIWHFLQRMQRHIKDGASVFTKTLDGKLVDGWVMLDALNAIGSPSDSDHPPANPHVMIGLGRNLSTTPASFSERQSIAELWHALEFPPDDSVLVVLPSLSPNETPESHGFGATAWKVSLTTDGHVPRKQPTEPSLAKASSPQHA